jgi:hypothetical protein
MVGEVVAIVRNGGGSMVVVVGNGGGGMVVIRRNDGGDIVICMWVFHRVCIFLLCVTYTLQLVA